MSQSKGYPSSNPELLAFSKDYHIRVEKSSPEGISEAVKNLDLSHGDEVIEISGLYSEEVKALCQGLEPLAGWRVFVLSYL